MAVRHRASLKTSAEKHSTKNSARSKPGRSNRRATLTRVAAQLVCSDPALAQFITSPVQSTSKNGSKKNDAATIASCKVEQAIQSLGKLEAEVIGSLFPSSGGDPESLEGLALRLGMTVEEVKGIADNALRGLRGLRPSGARISAVWN